MREREKERDGTGMRTHRAAEVGDLGRVVAGEEDVARVEVAVQDVALVEVGEAGRDLGANEHLAPHAERPPALEDAPVQAAVLAQLEDERDRRLGAGGGELERGAVEVDDVGVVAEDEGVELVGDVLHLGFEAGGLRDLLDGDVRVLVGAAVNLAKRAAVDLHGAAQLSLWYPL